MDGIDLPIAQMPNGSSDARPWDSEPPRVRALRSVAEPSVAEPSSQAEIDAILAAVPAVCRKDAAWAVPLLIDTARNGGITHPRRIAYLLATAHHASRFGAVLVETIAAPRADGNDRYFDRYEPGTSLGALYGNTQPGDGERFRGRGFVHVKGRANYAVWSQRLGMPENLVAGRPVPFFVAHPEAMARPHVAAQTLVRGMRDGIFTGAALGSYVNDKKTDYYNARRVIDGVSQAREVAALAVIYQAAIEGIAALRERAATRRLTHHLAAYDATRDVLHDVRKAVERLALRGETMAYPIQVLDWTGEARQGKFVQLDDRACALHIGRGVYVRLDIQRDLNGIAPPEAKNLALKRSGDVRPVLRSGAADFWR